MIQTSDTADIFTSSEESIQRAPIHVVVGYIVLVTVLCGGLAVDAAGVESSMGSCYIAADNALRRTNLYSSLGRPDLEDTGAYGIRRS